MAHLVPWRESRERTCGTTLMFRSAERTFKTGGGQTTALPNNLPTPVQNGRTMKVEIIAADPRHPSEEFLTPIRLGNTTSGAPLPIIWCCCCCVVASVKCIRRIALLSRVVPLDRGGPKNNSTADYACIIPRAMYK